MADSEEEKGFKVVDKRKVTADDTGEVHAGPDGATTEVTPPEEETPEGIGELPPVDVHSLIAYFIGVLGAQAWQWLGLAKNPVTGQVTQDLEQAKIAIDVIGFLAEQLEPKLTPSEQGDLRALVSDLRINFVQQSSKPS